MDPVMQIGANVDKQAVESVAVSICTIFEHAHKNHMEQETVRTALNTLGRVGAVEGVRIEGCTIRG